MFAQDSYPRINIMATSHNEKDTVKKVLVLPIIALLFLTSCLHLESQAESTLEPIPPTLSLIGQFDFGSGLIPEYRSVLQDLSDASFYSIEFIIADDLYHVTGSETIHYTNTENVSLHEVQLRLFPNILGGKMVMGHIKENGNVVTPRYSLNNSLLVIPLERSIEPKESITLSMDFDITVPQSVDLNYGVLAYADNVLALAHAYPMIAVYDEEGWNAEIPPQTGDVTYADMSFFVVTVDAPKKATLAGSGREVSRQDNGGRQTVRYEAGPVRDFYLAASPDYEVFTRAVNGVTLRFYTRDYLQAGAEFALDVAARSLEIFGERYAPYPYTELDFVSTPTHALGIEYPGMIAITHSILEPDNNYLEATIAHETAHQWFYNLVGNDQLDDPWLDESLAQFATLQYFTDEYGSAGEDGFRSTLAGRWSRIGNENIPVGLPVQDYSGAEYSGIIYGRGALFFESLREQMGREAFESFIKSYVQNNAWNIGTTEILKTAAEAQCGCDLSDLFKDWIYP
ncbi:MAG: M1 family peptidase [Anaerolineaceae bacterium]|nr:MAG: M1 family peptidase [Anaerolineaceae bacterium]